MPLLPSSLLALGFIYGCGVAAWCIIDRRWTPRGVIVFILGTLPAFAGFLIPADERIARAAITVLGFLTGGRILSYFCEGGRARLRDYLRFLSIGLLRPHL